MNYGELKAAVSSWANRSDLPISTISQLGNAEINRDVRVQAQEEIVTGALVGGRFAVPSDYLDARQLLIDGELHAFIPPEQYQREQEAQSTLKRFTRIGGYFYVVSGTTQAYSLVYRAKFESMSADADANWLLTNAPDLCVFVYLKHAAIWLKDAAAAQGYDAAYKAAVSSLNTSDRASMYAGPLVARVRGAV